MYPVAVYASVVQALPLVSHQKLAFFIGTLAVFFFSNSMGAQIAICEALLEVVARKLGDRATRALARGERLISDLPIRRD